MESMDIQPITNQPALFFKEKKMLIIADLHIGIERELRENGLNVSSQTNKMIKQLISLIKKYSPNKIVIVGDIKHNIPTSTYQERKDVKLFIEKIKKYGEVHIFPGNHDGNIRRFLSSEIFLYPSDGGICDDIGFIHGHRWPKEEVLNCNFVIIAHSHPRILFTDRLGYKYYKSCWLRGNAFSSLKKRYINIGSPKIIMTPAFNPLCGGIAVNVESIIGPFSKIFDIKNSNVYLLDGSSLGKLKNIK